MKLLDYADDVIIVRTVNQGYERGLRKVGERSWGKWAINEE